MNKLLTIIFLLVALVATSQNDSLYPKTIIAPEGDTLVVVTLKQAKKFAVRLEEGKECIELLQNCEENLQINKLAVLHADSALNAEREISIRKDTVITHERNKNAVLAEKSEFYFEDAKKQRRQKTLFGILGIVAAVVGIIF